MQFLSDEWAEAYTTLINEDEAIQKKLKRFSSLFKYEVTDKEELPALVIEVQKGKCTSFGEASAFRPKDIEFTMAADAQTWQKVFDHEIGMREAIKSHNFHIDGPKLKALSNKSGLEQSVKLMLNMKGIRV